MLLLLSCLNRNIRQPGARHALYILTLINFINYADRYVPAAVKELIKGIINFIYYYQYFHYYHYYHFHCH